MQVEASDQQQDKEQSEHNTFQHRRPTADILHVQISEIELVKRLQLLDKVHGDSASSP